MTFVDAKTGREHDRPDSVFALEFARHSRAYPNLSISQVLSDLWLFGWRNASTRSANKQREIERLNRDNNVIESVDELVGMKLVAVEPFKPGVYRYRAIRKYAGCMEMNIGFVRQDILRVAIETGVVQGPNHSSPARG